MSQSAGSIRNSSWLRADRVAPPFACRTGWKGASCCPGRSRRAAAAVDCEIDLHDDHVLRMEIAQLHRADQPVAPQFGMDFDAADRAGRRPGGALAGQEGP